MQIQLASGYGNMRNNVLNRNENLQLRRSKQTRLFSPPQTTEKQVRTEDGRLR